MNDTPKPPDAKAGFKPEPKDFLPLALIGVVTLSGAAWLFRRRLT